MSRGLGWGSELASGLEAAEPLLAVLTQLGDAWFLLTIGVALYWLGSDAPLAGLDRRDGVLVIGVALLAIATTYVLKALFALPRPPGAATPTYALEGVAGVVYTDAATGGGFGFPSGHATSTAAVYGTLAWLGGKRGRRSRVTVAAALVAVVSLTRVGLGVHYLVDVVAGAGVGLALATLAVRARDRPATVLGLAVLAAAVALFASPATARTAGLFGLAVGVFGAWWWLGRPTDGVAPPDRGVVAFGSVLVGLSVPAAWVGPVSAGAGLASLGAGLVVTALPTALRR